MKGDRILLPGLGERIRVARERRGLSQREVADLLGMTQQSIAHYERGALPPPPIFYLLSRLLECTPTELLVGLDEEVDDWWRGRLDQVVAAQVGYSYRIRQPSLPDEAHLQLSAALRASNAGRPAEAEVIVRGVIEAVRPVWQERPERLTTALTLRDACYLAAGFAKQLYRPDFLETVSEHARTMFDIAERNPAVPDATASGLMHLADAHMLVGTPEHLESAWDAFQRAQKVTKDHVIRMHLWRIGVALVRRRNAGEAAMRRLLRQIDREAPRVDPGTAAFTFQGAALNLAGMGRQHRQEAFRWLERAEEAYQEAIEAGLEDTHVSSLILRTRACLFATPGYGMDLEKAAIAAEAAFRSAQEAGRARTVQHSRLVLEAVAAGRPLEEIPT